MSHFGERCSQEKFQSSAVGKNRVVKLFLPSSTGGGEDFLVCEKLWDMAAANVFCKETKHPLGAASADSVPYESLKTGTLPRKCVSVRCQGYETSLAECVIYNKEEIGSGEVAAVTCYDPSRALTGNDCGFSCVNSKCISVNQTCDGVDDCGDRSDEMCCKKCRGDAFRCKTGVCIHSESLVDGQLDCLDGEDELKKHETRALERSGRVDQAAGEYVSPKTELMVSRNLLESQLYCGIPNKTTVHDTDVEPRGRTSRVKRVVGGVEANPTQIQWQIALEENRRVDCGGAYIGGCWVVTAAHCVRPKPSAFKVKFSVWKKSRAQDTTDIVPVEEIIIHPGYGPATYENDIALVKLDKLPFKEECVEDNPAISAVCLPWSTHLFQPGHTCSISGWGRTADGKAAQVLLWANVSLIDRCERFYKGRFRPGMMCAGDLEGSVDSCQGDSGGPLVCQDELGVSYLWGIVSWGERCGQPGFPGVYTQVAHYFEWIRLHTGWPAITRFNS